MTELERLYARVYRLAVSLDFPVDDELVVWPTYSYEGCTNTTSRIAPPGSEDAIDFTENFAGALFYLERMERALMSLKEQRKNIVDMT